MIVVDAGSQLRMVTQCDHAHLAAEILALVPALAGEPLRRTLLRATRRHDDGWQGVDAAPPVDEHGRPHDFLTLPWNLRTEVWDRGTALPDLEPAAALLIAEHAVALHRDHGSSSGSGHDLVELVTARRDALRERLGHESAQVSRLYPWLQAMDLLSLIVVNRWNGRTHVLETPWLGRAELDSGILRLDPCPMAGATTLHYPERLVAHRPYRDSLDLGTELALSRWTSDSVTIRSW
jgi:hypothetical protein